jgi:hypothetical protein
MRHRVTISMNARVYEFWQLVGEFLNRIQAPIASPIVSAPVELKGILAGLPSWKNSIPSLIVRYALADQALSVVRVCDSGGCWGTVK